MLYIVISPVDYKILKYISKIEQATEQEIVGHFSEHTDISDSKFRIDTMLQLKPSYLRRVHLYQHGSRPDGRTIPIRLSDVGIKSLADYELSKKENDFEKYFNRAIAVVALVISIIALLKP